ncbi:MAG: adenosylcobinamide-GDP ribazoletransferase [Rhodospirillaceae bacterium]|nr:MAG: adenosylcobinamide-GDP ribazoletransferase [Rhodospirillaceae bacterium]
MVKKPAKEPADNKDQNKTAPKEPEMLKPDAAHAESATEDFFTRLINQFSVAWMFLTRIPLPSWWNKSKVIEATGVVEDDTSPDNDTDKGKGMIPLSNTVRAWPVVGLAVGALAGGALWSAANLGLHPLAASFVAMIVAALVTGAIHEDGLADVADGFGGGDTRAKKLRIMRDSQIGTFGVLSLLLMIGFKAGAMAGFNAPGFAAAAVLSAHVLSRSFLPMLMIALPPARRNGLGQGAGIPKTENAVMAAAIGVLIAILTLGIGPGLVASGLAGLGVASVGAIAQRQIQGFTGDVLGAAQQVSEALVLAGIAVALRTVFY